MDRAAADLAKTATPAKVANSDAAALAGYLAALGWPVEPDVLNRLLALLAVLVIELGGGASLAIGMALNESGGRSGATEGVVGQGARCPLDKRPNHPTGGYPRTHRPKCPSNQRFESLRPP